VANALSQYCAYLVKSAPELLPGPVATTKRVYRRFQYEFNPVVVGASDKDTILATMSDRPSSRVPRDWYAAAAKAIDPHAATRDI
jgi:hypothetical protein